MNEIVAVAVTYTATISDTASKALQAASTRREGLQDALDAGEQGPSGINHARSNACW